MVKQDKTREERSVGRLGGVGRFNTISHDEKVLSESENELRGNLLEKSSVRYSPASGRHYVYYDGRIIGFVART